MHCRLAHDSLQQTLNEPFEMKMSQVFKSTQIVVTGARKYNDIVVGFNDIIGTLRKYFVYRAGTYPESTANGDEMMLETINLADDRQQFLQG